MKMNQLLTTIIISIGLVLLYLTTALAVVPTLAVSSCGVLSANNTIYIVTQNITTASTGDCLVLSGSNDSLNIQDFNITGPGTGTSTGVGVHITGSNNVIEGSIGGGGGIVSGFATGVLDTGLYTIGDDLNMISNGIGLQLSGTTNIWVDFASETNTAQGLYITNCLNGCSAKVFYLYKNGGDGALITNSNHTSLELFVDLQNGGHGIHVGCTSGCGTNTNINMGNAEAGNDIGTPAVSLNTGDGIFLDASESAAVDQVYLLVASGNHGIDLHDATSTCGSNHWFNLQSGTSNAGGVSNPTCINPTVPPPLAVNLIGIPTHGVGTSTSITGSLAFGTSLQSGDIVGCWTIATPGTILTTPATGYTAAPNTNLATPLGRITNLFTHVWNTGDTLNPVFNFLNPGGGEYICFGYRGGNTISASNGMSNAASTTMTSASVNPGFTNGKLLMLYAADLSGTVSNPSIGTIQQTDSNNGRELALVDNSFITAANTGNQTAQISVSTGSVGVQVTIPGVTAPTPTPTPTPTPIPTATPTPGAPNPPPLVNPHNPVNYGADPTGVNDSTSYFVTTLGLGDMDIPAGTFVLNVGQIAVTGRNIRCEPGAILKQTVLQGNLSMFQVNQNSTIFNCDFRGVYYNVQPHLNAFYEDFLHVNNAPVTIVGNRFNGTPGYTGSIDVFSTATGTGSIVGWNSFKNCAYYGIQLIQSKNLLFEYNTLQDCAGIAEANVGLVNTGNVSDHNNVSFVFGVGWQNFGSGSFTPNARASYYGCGDSANGNGFDYSGNTCQNDVIQGPHTPSYLWESCDAIATPFCPTGAAIGSWDAKYINETCNSGCTLQSNNTRQTFFIDNSGSPTCSDANAGTLQSAPWCSVDRVNTALAAATPGTTFLFKTGDTWTYNTTNWTTAAPYGIHPSASGTAALPILISSYGSGARPIFNGASGACIGVDGANPACPSSAEVAGAFVQYVQVDNLEIKNTTDYGIVFKNSTSNPQKGIIISNNFVHDTGCATEPGTCADNGFYWNQIEYADYQYNADCVQLLNNTTQRTGGHNALLVHGDTCTSALVQGNTIIGPWNHNGLDIKEANGLTVNQNTSYCPTGVGTCPGEAFNYQFTQRSPNSVIFTRNLAYGPISGGGLICSWGGTFDGPTCLSGNCNGTCTVLNNTLMNTVGTSFGTDAVSAGLGTETTTVDFRNNITNIRSELATAANGTNTHWLKWNYNDDCVGVIGGVPCWVWTTGVSYSTISAFQIGTGLGANDLFDINPQFISPSTGNYAIPISNALATAGDPLQPAGVPYIGAIAPQ